MLDHMLRALSGFVGVALATGCIVPPKPSGHAIAFVPSGLAALLPVEKKTLPNGLTVLLHEDHRAPLVRIVVSYATGAASEAPGRAGMAHLVEHLMFRGTRNAPDGTLKKVLDLAGASDINATTKRDATEYYEM